MTEPWTPGPWKWLEDAEYMFARTLEESGVVHGDDIICMVGEENGPLISLAPEMAEWIERVLAYYDETSHILQEDLDVGSDLLVRAARGAGVPA